MRHSEIKMDQVDVVIIGAGIVGLAVAARLSRRYSDVLILEKEASFGRHGSSHNSEVIHSGIYYPANSLKARLCVRGSGLLYEYLGKNGIGFRRCGKLVLASSPADLSRLERLLDKGRTNGVEGLEILSRDRICRLEPMARAWKGLWVPSTGIMDTHGAMKTFLHEAESHGALAVYNSEVSGLEFENGDFILAFKDQDYKIRARIVINAAGLWSDRVASMAGIDPEKAGYKLYWNKGEYYKTSRYRNMSHLIYPVPHPQGLTLGIHSVINLNGEVSFGPNSYRCDKLDYSIDGKHKSQFLEVINTYLDIEEEDIWPDTTGIRPKLQRPGEEEKDFVIVNETGRGRPNLINLIGIESPGLTSCLAVAEMVEGLIED